MTNVNNTQRPGQVTAAQQVQQSAIKPKTTLDPSQVYDAAFEQMGAVQSDNPDPLLLKQTAPDEALGMFRGLANTYLKGVSAGGDIANEFQTTLPQVPLSEMRAQLLFGSAVRDNRGTAIGVSLDKASDALVNMQADQLHTRAELQQTTAGAWALGPGSPLLKQLMPFVQQALKQRQGNSNHGPASVTSNAEAAQTASGGATSPAAASSAQTIFSSPKAMQLMSAIADGPGGQIQFAGQDIDSIVEGILFLCASDQETDLRAQMQTMSANIQKKKAQRELIKAQQELQTKANTELQQEYQQLSAAGDVGCTFADYAAARGLAIVQPQAGINAAGENVVIPGSVQLPDPSWVTDPKAIPVNLRPKGDPNSPDTIAQTYGLPPELVQELQNYWDSQNEPGDFSTFVAKLGAKPATSQEDAQANIAAIQAHLTGKNIPGDDPAQDKSLLTDTYSLNADTADAVIAAYQAAYGSGDTKDDFSTWVKDNMPGLKQAGQGDDPAAVASNNNIDAQLYVDTDFDSTAQDAIGTEVQKYRVNLGDPNNAKAMAALYKAYIASGSTGGFDAFLTNACAPGTLNPDTSIDDDAANDALVQAAAAPYLAPPSTTPDDPVADAQWMQSNYSLDNPAPVVAAYQAAVAAGKTSSDFKTWVKGALPGLETADPNNEDDTARSDNDGYVQLMQATGFDPKGVAAINSVETMYGLDSRDYGDIANLYKAFVAGGGTDATQFEAFLKSKVAPGTLTANSGSSDNTDNDALIHAAAVAAGNQPDPQPAFSYGDGSGERKKLLSVLATAQGNYKAIPFDGSQSVPQGMQLTAYAALQNNVDNAKGDLDTMNDETQLDQMKMQEYMENRSKCYEAISNIMKAVASTADGIVANLKE